MATDESTIPLSVGDKAPQVHQIETGDPKFNTEHGGIAMPTKATRMVGLTKEQLEEYRNSSFWRPLRLFFFVMFWLAWVVMFAGAIIIVVLSPKCAAKDEPEWWRTKVSYQVYTPTFYDTNGDGIGDFKGIEEKLNEIRRLGVQNIWVSPIIDTQKDDFLPFDVVDFEKVDERYGSKEDLASLISATHDVGLHFVMDLPISTTSPNHIWFEDAKRSGKYRDYYVWRDTPSEDYLRLESDKIDAYYLAYGRDPVLNWSNPEVRAAILDIAKSYLDLGVDGFHIAHINQLMKAEDRKIQGGAALEALKEFTKTLETYVETKDELKSKQIAIFTTLNDIEKLQIDNYSASSLEYIIDDSLIKLDKKTCGEKVARCLHNALTESLKHFEEKQLPHVWQITNMDSSRPTSRFDSRIGNLMTFMQLTLPGAVEIYYGQELGLTDMNRTTHAGKGLMQWDDSANAGFSTTSDKPFFTTTNDYKTINHKLLSDDSDSIYRTVRSLMKLRQRDETMIFGEIALSKASDDVLMFTRMRKSENTIVGSVYITILNFGIADSQVDIKEALPKGKTAEIVEVVAVYPKSTSYYKRMKLDLSDTKVELFPKQAILLKI